MVDGVASASPRKPRPLLPLLPRLDSHRLPAPHAAVHGAVRAAPQEDAQLQARQRGRRRAAEPRGPAAARGALARRPGGEGERKRDAVDAAAAGVGLGGGGGGGGRDGGRDADGVPPRALGRSEGGRPEREVEQAHAAGAGAFPGAHAAQDEEAAGRGGGADRRGRFGARHTARAGPRPLEIGPQVAAVGDGGLGEAEGGRGGGGRVQDRPRRGEHARPRRPRPRPRGAVGRKGGRHRARVDEERAFGRAVRPAQRRRRDRERGGRARRRRVRRLAVQLGRHQVGQRVEGGRARGAQVARLDVGKAEHAEAVPRPGDDGRARVEAHEGRAWGGREWGSGSGPGAHRGALALSPAPRAPHVALPRTNGLLAKRASRVASGTMSVCGVGAASDHPQKEQRHGKSPRSKRRPAAERM